jgi:mono/diheme cytochrome c family protein
MRIFSTFVLAGLICGAMLAPSIGMAETPLERGRYLVTSIAGCGNCHTPKDKSGPIAGHELAGNWVVEDNPAFRAVASNITPDKATGIGAWTDAQIITAIREGIRPDGTLIGPPMPFQFYRHISDTDVTAIVAYLRSVPAVSSVAEKSVYHILLPPSYGPKIETVAGPDPSDRMAYGAYMAGPLGHCLECHSPLLPSGQRDLTRAGAGGQPFAGPWGVAVAANITSSKSVGLGAWSDAEIERAIRHGISHDGRKLSPPMGYAYYDHITAADMAALISFLRTLPAVE